MGWVSWVFGLVVFVGGLAGLLDVADFWLRAFWFLGFRFWCVLVGLIGLLWVWRIVSVTWFGLEFCSGWWGLGLSISGLTVVWVDFWLLVASG